MIKVRLNFVKLQINAGRMQRWLFVSVALEVFLIVDICITGKCNLLIMFICTAYVTHFTSNIQLFTAYTFLPSVISHIILFSRIAL